MGTLPERPAPVVTGGPCPRTWKALRLTGIPSGSRALSRGHPHSLQSAGMLDHCRADFKQCPPPHFTGGALRPEGARGCWASSTIVRPSQASNMDTPSGPTQRREVRAVPMGSVGRSPPPRRPPGPGLSACHGA